MYQTISEAINSAKNPYFYVDVKNGIYNCGNKESYFSERFPDDNFTFDVGNNKALCNMSEFGEIKNLTFYRNSYLCDDIPGVWVRKDFSTSGPLSFSICMDGERLDFKKWNGKSESDLLDNLFPRTKFTNESIKATILAFAPVRANGDRLRAIVYGIYLENISERTVDLAVEMPQFGSEKDCFATHGVSWLPVEERFAEDQPCKFQLSARQSKWISVVLYAPGEYQDAEAVVKKGMLFWLNETHDYLRKILGRLTMPGDPMTAFLYERAVCQCLGAIAMNQEDQISGANWGSYPATSQIWMKDMYYAFLPFSILEPDLFKKGILWFLKYGIRPKGGRFDGGVYHSLTNSLSSVIMAGLYYEYTGDNHLFLSNPWIYEKMEEIMAQVMELKAPDAWLFPSLWISDALSLGKYHTGSNVLVWKAFQGLSLIARNVLDDEMKAKEYQDIAQNVFFDIEKYMTLDGKFGQQYLEGIGGLTPEEQRFYPVSHYEKKYIGQVIHQFLEDVISDGKINLLMHDGEESDTTLMPFYGYQRYDAPSVRNYAKFTTSFENPTYGEQCRGITWGNESGATFPGYTTAFLGVVDQETMNGDRGYLRELKRLADADGSWWWWPYPLGSKTGEVARLYHNCGKCGWASGVFAVTFLTQILGLQYCGATQKLIFRPFSPCSDFTFEGIRLGNAVFDVDYKHLKNQTSIQITNRNDFSIALELEVISDGEAFCATETISSKKRKFMERGTVATSLKLQKNETVQVNFS